MFLIIFWYIYQILRKIFYKQKKLSYMIDQPILYDCFMIKIII